LQELTNQKVRVVLGEGCFLEQVAGYFKVKVASWSRLQVAGFKGAGCFNVFPATSN
jgi:hypothetical protein